MTERGERSRSRALGPVVGEEAAVPSVAPSRRPARRQVSPSPQVADRTRDPRDGHPRHRARRLHAVRRRLLRPRHIRSIARDAGSIPSRCVRSTTPARRTPQAIPARRGVRGRDAPVSDPRAALAELERGHGRRPGPRRRSTESSARRHRRAPTAQVRRHGPPRRPPRRQPRSAPSPSAAVAQAPRRSVTVRRQGQAGELGQRPRRQGQAAVPAASSRAGQTGTWTDQASASAWSSATAAACT